MKKASIKHTYINQIFSTKIPTTRKASNKKFKTFKEDAEFTGMIEVQGKQKYTSLKQIILGVLTLQLSISNGLTCIS